MKDIVISIIIPYYNETANEIFPLLSSINGQLGVDFNKIECILVNGGNQNIFSSDFLNLFEKLNIRCIYMPEDKGPGMARQYGIDNALGEYVMFCDADDILYSVNVLYSFIKAAKKEQPDILKSPWFEETFNVDTKEYSYILHDNDYTWMHGKLFHTAFLCEKNIRFHEQLRVHEDTYFLTLASMDTDNIYTINLVSYVWKYHESSITRKDSGAYSVNSITEHIRAIMFAYEIIEIRHPEKLHFLITEFVIFYYFYLHNPRWINLENSEHFIKTESAFCKAFIKYQKYYYEAPAELVASLYNRKRDKTNSDMLESETLDEWLKRLIR